MQAILWWMGWGIKLHSLRHGHINECRGLWLNDLSVILPETQTLTQCLETLTVSRGFAIRVSTSFKMMQNESVREYVSQCLTQSLSEFSEHDKQQCRNSWLRMLPKYSNTKNTSRLLRQGFGSWNLNICHKCIPGPVPFYREWRMEMLDVVSRGEVRESRSLTRVVLIRIRTCLTCLWFLHFFQR